MGSLALFEEWLGQWDGGKEIEVGEGVGVETGIGV